MTDVLIPILITVGIVGPAVLLLVCRDSNLKAKIAREAVRVEAVIEEHSDTLGVWEERIKIRPTDQEKLEMLKCFHRDTIGHPVVRMLLVLLAVMVLFVALKYVLLDFESWMERGEYGELLIIPLALTGISVLVFRPWKARKQMLAGELDHLLPRSMEFSAGGVRVGEQVEPILWEQVRCWYEKASGVLFELNSNQRFFVPRSSFEDDGRLRAFLEKLRTIKVGVPLCSEE